MQPRDDARLLDMLTYGRRVQDRLRGVEREAFDEDDDLQMAITYRLQVIGEAASHVSEEARGEHPEIPWHDIIGMRHRLVHNYGAINLDRVWETATRDVPALLVALNRILEQRNTE